jgi:hypothetical protein
MILCWFSVQQRKQKSYLLDKYKKRKARPSIWNTCTDIVTHVNFVFQKKYDVSEIQRNDMLKLPQPGVSGGTVLTQAMKSFCIDFTSCNEKNRAVIRNTRLYRNRKILWCINFILLVLGHNISVFRCNHLLLKGTPNHGALLNTCIVVNYCKKLKFNTLNKLFLLLFYVKYDTLPLCSH